MKLEIWGNKEAGFSAHGEYEPKIDQPLEPCPFCGSHDLEVSNSHTPSYSVECLCCEAEKCGAYHYGKKCKTERKAELEHRKAFTSAIQEWNKRV